MSLDKIYNDLCNKPSDINEHLPTLKLYGEKVKTITEFGTRFGVSTFSFILSKPKKFTTYNIIDQLPSDILSLFKQYCKDNSILFQYEIQDVLNIQIDETDLLFIDTLHTYNQLTLELNIYHSKVRQYIILHDTESFKFKDENIYGHASSLIKNKIKEKTGLYPAILNFLDNHKEFIIEKEFKNNYGLTILKRI